MISTIINFILYSIRSIVMETFHFGTKIKKNVLGELSIERIKVENKKR